MSLNYYLLYDNKIMSDINFCELLDWPEGRPETGAPIIIKYGMPSDYPYEMQRAKENKLFGAALSRSEVWFTNQYGTYLVRNGSEIYAEAYEKVNPAELNVFILGYCIAFAFWQRGEYAFHCGTVYNPKSEKAIIVTGVSGAGKSTFTSKLLENGCELMADDVAVVECRKDAVVAKAAYPQQKLCRDQVISRGLDMDKLRYIDEDKDKFALKLEEGFHVETAPVEAIVYITKHSGAELIVNELEGLDKIKVIADNMFLNPAFKQEGVDASPAEMFEYLELASRVRVIHMTRPMQGNTVIQMYDRLMELL